MQAPLTILFASFDSTTTLVASPMMRKLQFRLKTVGGKGTGGNYCAQANVK